MFTDVERRQASTHHHDYWNGFYAGRASGRVPEQPSAFASWVDSAAARRPGGGRARLRHGPGLAVLRPPGPARAGVRLRRVRRGARPEPGRGARVDLPSSTCSTCTTTTEVSRVGRRARPRRRPLVPCTAGSSCTRSRTPAGPTCSASRAALLRATAVSCSSSSAPARTSGRSTSSATTTSGSFLDPMVVELEIEAARRRGHLPRGGLRAGRLQDRGPACRPHRRPVPCRAAEVRPERTCREPPRRGDRPRHPGPGRSSDEVVDVRFDGERVWSFNPQRERTRLHRGWVRWPTDLAALPGRRGRREPRPAPERRDLLERAGRLRHADRPDPDRRRGRTSGRASTRPATSSACSRAPTPR